MSAGVKLSSVDGSFLYLETPETPMHVGSLHLFEPPAGPRRDFREAIKKLIASRIDAAPPASMHR